ncbi:GIY-YIG nuclease family protein [Oryzomonas rubra]|uniref:GIY-YIG nuclease family protein n=1 Tax=Oryzomonas rubra TaxID=2509454 RepID=A0A5A9X4E8_9BACT|nr:GIY-YIG nuclease family protein [Oryzomonas rubra]KAA0888022.1 GIY-YIG nuclease family protein [Oryzomonas rubra]
MSRNEGILYFLVNKAMPGLLKVGYTLNALEQRLSQLNSTGVPFPFTVGASFLVQNPKKVEQEIHAQLKQYRINDNREFFCISLQKALESVTSIVLKHVSISCDSINNQIDEASALAHDLEQIDINILKTLATEKRSQGLPVYNVGDPDESDLETENRLANLKERRLVEEKRSRETWQGNLWRITSKGVKFLFDHNLIDATKRTLL